MGVLFVSGEGRGQSDIEDGRSGCSHTNLWMRLMESRLGGRVWPDLSARCSTTDVVGFILFTAELTSDAINTTVC